MVTGEEYFRVNLPSVDGPSLGAYRLNDNELTAATNRTVATTQPFALPDADVAIQETVVTTAGNGETGVTLFDAAFNGPDALVGEWEFTTSDQLTFCGTLTANRLPDGPPSLAYPIDLEPTGISLDATDLVTPSTVQVLDRAYRIRYSMLTESVELRYLLSSDELPNEGDILLGSEEILPGLPGNLGPHAGPGPELTIPAELPDSCTMYVLAVIDAGESETESNETNNVFSVNVTVSLDGDPPCDVGACCGADGECLEIEELHCLGYFQGAETECASVNCLTACCLYGPRGVGAECIDVPLDECTGSAIPPGHRHRVRHRWVPGSNRRLLPLGRGLQ